MGNYDEDYDDERSDYDRDEDLEMMFDEEDLKEMYEEQKRDDCFICYWGHYSVGTPGSIGLCREVCIRPHLGNMSPLSNTDVDGSRFHCSARIDRICGLLLDKEYSCHILE